MNFVELNEFKLFYKQYDARMVDTHTVYLIAFYLD